MLTFQKRYLRYLRHAPTLVPCISQSFTIIQSIMRNFFSLISLVCSMNLASSLLSPSKRGVRTSSHTQLQVIGEFLLCFLSLLFVVWCCSFALAALNGWRINHKVIQSMLSQFRSCLLHNRSRRNSPSCTAWGGCCSRSLPGLR